MTTGLSRCFRSHDIVGATSLASAVRAPRGSILGDVGCRLRAVTERRLRLVLWRLPLTSRQVSSSTIEEARIYQLSRVNNIVD